MIADEEEDVAPPPPPPAAELLDLLLLLPPPLPLPLAPPPPPPAVPVIGEAYCNDDNTFVVLSACHAKSTVAASSELLPEAAIAGAGRLFVKADDNSAGTVSGTIQ